MWLAFTFGDELAGINRRETAATPTQQLVARLFDELREDVYRYLVSLGLPPAPAQEAAQEVFLRLYTALQKGEKIQSHKGWIFRVAHNLGLKIRARQEHELPFDPGVEARLLDAAPNPETALLDRERTLRFHRAVEGLSEQQRRCLFLRLEGLRYPEIASVLGLSASTVGEFLRRAMQRLKAAGNE